MSGGTFNYRNYVLDDIADVIQHVIDQNDNTELDEWGDTKGRHFPPEVITRLKETVLTLARASIMVHHVDYLLDGDLSHESFLKVWKKELEPNGTP